MTSNIFELNHWHIKPFTYSTGLFMIAVKKMIKTDRFKKIEVSSSAELRQWLKSNHHQEESVWLVTYKKVVPDKYVSVSQILDELICFGWIDGIRRKLDDRRTMQLISPRQAQHWALSYKLRAERLIREDKMNQAGLDSIKHSKDIGMWNFMDDVDKLIIPNDLDLAFKSHPGSRDFFKSQGASRQRFVLRWIKLAKTDKTRHSRIMKTVQLAAKGEKVPGS